MLFLKQTSCTPSLPLPPPPPGCFLSLELSSPKYLHRAYFFISYTSLLKCLLIREALNHLSNISSHPLFLFILLPGFLFLLSA